MRGAFLNLVDSRDQNGTLCGPHIDFEGARGRDGCRGHKIMGRQTFKIFGLGVVIFREVKRGGNRGRSLGGNDNKGDFGGRDNRIGSRLINEMSRYLRRHHLGPQTDPGYTHYRHKAHPQSLPLSCARLSHNRRPPFSCPTYCIINHERAVELCADNAQMTSHPSCWSVLEMLPGAIATSQSHAQAKYAVIKALPLRFPNTFTMSRSRLFRRLGSTG